MSGPSPEALRPVAAWSVPLSAILLAAWIGAALYFSIVVTRAAFAVLPSRTLAGALVGQTLPVLYDTGMLVGTILVVSASMSPTGIARSTSVLGGVVIVGLTAVARFLILTRIARLRLVDDPSRRAFGQLHAMSVGALGLAMLAGLIVVIVLSRSLTIVAHD